MAAVVYNVAKKGMMDGSIDLDSGGDDIRILLLEGKTGIDADHTSVQAALNPAGVTELSSTNYVRVALASESTSQDDANDRAEFDSDNVTFSNIVQAAAETVVGWIVFKFVTNDASSTPLWFDDTASELPLTPNGSDIVITVDAQGWLHLT